VDVKIDDDRVTVHEFYKDYGGGGQKKFSGKIAKVEPFTPNIRVFFEDDVGFMDFGDGNRIWSENLDGGEFFDGVTKSSVCKKWR
jgi:hypothetical protein